MGIDCTTPEEAFKRMMLVIPQVIHNEIIRAFAYLGEECIIKIRDRAGEDSWFDQTGNLRSSIGYAIYAEGRKVIESAFQQVGNGTQGASAGRKLIDELADKYSETYALVIVAGMDYAEYVEAMDGKDVLATTELWAKQKINDSLAKALDRAQKKIEEYAKQLGL